MNQNELHKAIFRNFIEIYGCFKEFQLCSSNLNMISLLFFIENNLRKKGYKINIFIIRPNRIKTGLTKKIEGEINDTKIVLIDDIIHNYSNIYYVEESLKIKKKKIFSVYSPILNENILDKEHIKKYNINYFSLVNTVDNQPLFTNQKKLKYVGSFIESNRFNTYNKISPIIYKDIILLISDLGEILALNKKTYKKIWNYKVKMNYENHAIDSEPILIGEELFVGVYNGDLLKINLKTGSLLKQISVGDYITYGISYSKKHNLIFIIGENISEKIGNYFINIYDKDSLKLINQITLNFIPSTKIEIIDKLNYIVLFSEEGLLYIFDIESNKELYSEKIDGVVKSGVSLIKKENKIIFGTNNGKLYNFDLINRKIIFEIKLNNYWIYSKALVVNDYIYVGSMDKLMYIINKGGGIVSHIKTEGRIFSNPVLIKNKYIVFGSNDKRIYKYDVSNGKLDSFQISERIVNEVVYDDVGIKLLDFNNSLYTMNF